MRLPTLIFPSGSRQKKAMSGLCCCSSHPMRGKFCSSQNPRRTPGYPRIPGHPDNRWPSGLWPSQWRGSTSNWYPEPAWASDQSDSRASRPVLSVSLPGRTGAARTRTGGKATHSCADRAPARPHPAPAPARRLLRCAPDAGPRHRDRQ